MRPRVLQNVLYPDQSESLDKITKILAVSLCLIIALSPLFSKVASNIATNETTVGNVRVFVLRNQHINDGRLQPGITSQSVVGSQIEVR